jgi:hypothetical protein
LVTSLRHPWHVGNPKGAELAQPVGDRLPMPLLLPRRRKKRRTGTFDTVLGPVTDSSRAIDETDAFDEGADALEDAPSVEDADTADRAPP